MHGVRDEQHTRGAAGVAAVTPVTRLAPSPTGALHLGNARTFLINWALARRHGWRIVLRIEDLDTPRNKPHAAERAINDLLWLGIDWDEGPLLQSADLAPHIAAMDRLAQRGLAYPCELTRTQIEAAASAPQESAPGISHEVAFPASLRPAISARPFEDAGTNWRFVTPDDEVSFTDDFAGPKRRRPASEIGDFVIWTNRGCPAYQLAVVVDDARQGVTHVVRGDDLLDSAARQVLLYRALGLGEPPRYCHVPLVRGADGRRLAKRHGDTRVSRYREAGVTAERVIGLMAWWCGLRGHREAMSAHEFAAGAKLETMPRADVTFGPEDDAWLLAGRS